ncbi:MAG TPA: 16S rRNA (uracil(1498)-N(3))-methyltransferase [Pyrinomonadaceae bacterium]|nr:16S rRNA (uracil(1498)-N(3))-methyltransferase [Pyrinomonadaceae bacterium]
MIRRFYAPRPAFATDEKSVVLDADETLHLRDVLRLHRGDEVLVFDGSGREFHCAIEEITRSSSRLEVLSEVAPSRAESPLNLSLAIALLKHEKFDLVVQKATELGVNRIIPATSDRADVRPRSDEQAGKRVARWQRIALEAAKQSGRARVPEIAVPRAFADVVKNQSAEESQQIMFAERAGQSLEQACLTFPSPVLNLIALVGPEGGWADFEIDLARECGWGIVTLGGRVMRAETAAIAIVTLLQHRFGDLV